MRQTIYIPGTGYITTDNKYEYIGNGILGDTFNMAKDLIFSKPVKDLAIEGAKSFGTTLAKQGGEKAANKIVSKVFDKTEKEKESRPVSNPIGGTKPTKAKAKSDIDVLKAIYGDGLFKKSGKRKNVPESK